MKKYLLIAALIPALFLGACKPGSVDVSAIVNATKAACSFTPAANGVIALINAQSAAGVAAQTAIEIAQAICAAVNNVNPVVTPGGGTKFAKGTELSVVVMAGGIPVTIAGVTGK